MLRISASLHASLFIFLVTGCTKSISPQNPKTPEQKTRSPNTELAKLLPAKPPSDPGISLLASAPRGFSIAHLGRPYTADFIPFQGPDGRNLFPSSGAPITTPQAYMEHNFVVIDTEEKLAANASAWTIGADFKTNDSNRYISYRAVQIAETHEIDDTTQMREPPQNAVYYPAKVFMGHSYEALIEGSQTEFHTGVRAELMKASVSIDEFARTHSLLHRSVGYGLRPMNGKAIFAKTQEQIQNSYYADTEISVPILVEWREIPGRRGHKKPIEWRQLNKGRAGQRGCEPCSKWEINYIEWQLPERDRSGNKWDSVNGLPDAVLILRIGSEELRSTEREVYRFKWKLPSAKPVSVGTIVRLTAVDLDGTDEELMGSLSARIQEYHDEQGIVGKIFFENGSAFMTGRCINP